MEDIAIGVLKSNHNLKLKKALLEKILSSGENSSKFDSNTFLNKIEKHWQIGAESNFTNLNSFLSHYDLIELVLNYLLNHEKKQQEVNEEEENKYLLIKFQIMLAHLTELIKLAFELNASSCYGVQLVLNWERLVISTFMSAVKNFELCANFINLIQTFNFCLIKQQDENGELRNFLYFVQNDTTFCADYLNFVKSLLPLFDKHIESANLKETALVKQNELIFEYFLNNLLGCLRILIVKVVFKQQLLNRNERLKTDFKTTIDNLNEIARLVEVLVARSPKLYEFTLRIVFDLLCGIETDNESTQQSNVYINRFAQVLKCFDVNKSVPFIVKYIYENKEILFAKEDAGLKQLLSNLIDISTWFSPTKIDEWVCAVMSILAVKFQKFYTLISICEQKCDFILNLVNFKNQRESALNILAFFIVNYQHSPKLFHKCCPRLADLLKILKPKKDISNPELTIAEQKHYSHLALLCFAGINKFGGYPQIYTPLLNVIQNDIDLTNLDSFTDSYNLETISSKLNIDSIPIGPNDSTNHDTKTNSFREYGPEPNPYSTDDSSLLISEISAGKKIRTNLTGLINMGNTCYLNSIVQALYACKKFVKAVIEIDSNEIQCGKNVDEVSFLDQLRVLFTRILMTKRPAIKASIFVKNCIPAWFRLGQQQDSSEFLNFLLDNLDEELKRKTSNYALTSLIRRSFGIQLRTECTCANCHTKTSRLDTSFYLPLSFSQSSTSHQTSIQNLIESFFELEQLSSENDNSYFCSKCDSLQNASKRIKFSRDSDRPPPDYLILTLNRFVYKVVNGNVEGNVKIMDKVDLQSKIEISVHEGERVYQETYAIHSIVVHCGSSLHHGHYYVYFENLDHEWFLANDSEISEVSFESLSSNQTLFKDDTPYVLFYRRVDLSDPSLTISVPNTKLVEIIENDNEAYEKEVATREARIKSELRQNYRNKLNKNGREDDDENDDDDGSKREPYNCSNDSGPRVVF